MTFAALRGLTTFVLLGGYSASFSSIVGGLVGGFRHMLYPFEATLCDFLANVIAF